MRLLVVTLVLAGALASVVGPGPTAATAQAGPPDRQALRSQLLQAADGRGRLAEHRATGRTRFFGTNLDRPVAAAGGSPEAAARSFLATYGPLFGADAPGRDLRLARTKAADQGRSSVRFQQTHRSVPVLGGELIVNLDRDRKVLSTTADLSPEPTVDVKPVVPADRAAAEAVLAVSKQRSVDPGLLRAAEPALWVYDPVLLEGSLPPGTHLVWRTEVTSEAGGMRELVLVDAHRGGIVLNFDQVAHAKDRRICDRNNVVDGIKTCVAPYARSEGGAPTGIAAVDTMYTYAGNVYDFFLANFGRDSVDGAGLPLISSVRYCDTASDCPMRGAFWDQGQTAFGEGYIVDDIVGHEFAHGFTEFESNLWYTYQSGAINESMSDVFGELIDLANGLGNDSPGVRWLGGEDSSGGAIRNMADPPALGDPDSMTSPNYWTRPEDNGGVHTNSGVNNKAAYLMTDGGTFNGITVTGLGTTKVAHIYYEAITNLLTSGSDYLDLFHALKQACLNKVGVAGITTANCAEVEKAVTATRMDVPAPGLGAREAPVCPAGTAPADLFVDDMENPGSGNWTFAGTGGGGWSFAVGKATSGVRSMYGRIPDTASNRTSTRSAAVVPRNGQTTYLRFNHAFETEANYDGGVVEHTTNGGATWVDSGPLFTDNGYNRTNTEGPLAGKQVFGGTSMGFGSSRIDLTSLAGQNVHFRFRFASDQSVQDEGWDVDDVRVYTCSQPGTAPAITSAGGAAFTEGAGGSFTVTATGSPAPTLSVSGALPGGVTFNSGTGVLSGTPAAGSAGAYALTFTAANGVSPNATQGFTLTVVAPAGSDFTPLTPARIFDTRSSLGGHPGKLAVGETANVVVTGVGGVPASGVDAVVLNVTATEATAGTFLTVFPTGQTRPFASNLNVVPNQDVPNLVVAKVGANGSVALYNNMGSVNVIFDVVGWYRPAATCFTSLTPARILDTRSSAKVGSGQTRDVQVTGVGGVPSSGVGAVVLNVTATEATAGTFLSVFPTGQTRPVASNLNVVPNQDVPNLVVAKVGSNGSVSVYNNQGATHVIFDVVGWHPSSATCFTSLTPSRTFDSRSTTPVGVGQSRDVKVTGTGGVPATGVGAVVLNVTATQATAGTFLTVFPTGQARPFASNLNVVPNKDVPNLVVAKVGADGNVTVYNNSGSTHVIFDVVGFFPG